MPDDSGRPDLTLIAEERAAEEREHEPGHGESEPPDPGPFRGLHYQDETGLHLLANGLVDAADGTVLVKKTVGGKPVLVLEDVTETGGIPITQKGAHGGVATLDGGGLLPLGELPVLTAGMVGADDAGAAAAAQAAAEAASAQGFNPVPPQAGAYTAKPGEYVPVDISGGSVTVKLPAKPADKTRIGLKIVAVSGTPGSTTLAINRGGEADVFNVEGGSTSLTLSARFQGVVLQYKASTGIWYVQTTDTPLNEALGAALLGTDGTVGGPSGSALSPSVERGSAITAGESLGAARSIAMVANTPQWLTGTLSANLVVTVTAFPAGSRALLKLTQGSTPWTLAINDGTTTVPVSIPTGSGVFFEVGLSSADGVTIDVELLGVPGTKGEVGQTGLQGVKGVEGPTGPSGASPNPPSKGEEGFDRFWATSTVAMTSGFLRLTYFTARLTETIKHILLTSAGTAAGATPTLVRAGIWGVNESDSLTALLAASANLTSIYAANNTEYLAELTAAFEKVAGVRYAMGVLVVTAATAPTVPCTTIATSVLSGSTQNRRRISATVTGLANLPETQTISTANNSSAAPYIELVP